LPARLVEKLFGVAFRITVVGAGVVGLSCAAALQAAGHAVRVVAPEAPTTSEVAGGLWLPYATGEDPRTLRWAVETAGRLEGDGHPLVDYLHLEREPPFWLDALAASGRVRDARRDELPSGYERGWVAHVPLVQMPLHLEALRRGLPPVERRRVRALEEELGGADLVVNCAGLAAGALAGGDDALRPVRGQVVLVDAPPGTPCVCDEDELTYVLPRADVCVVGGTYRPDDADTDPRQDETRAILARARRLVPRLEDAPVRGVRVGLRPARDGGPRVERQGGVVHCYGHGGAGLTLSWGCAAEVVRLVEAGS
jgi:D-amino-acid oxidase